MDKYNCTCILCGRISDLRMIAHRISDKLVGWIFACEKCESDVVDRNLVLQPNVQDGSAEYRCKKCGSELGHYPNCPDGCCTITPHSA